MTTVQDGALSPSGMGGSSVGRGRSPETPSVWPFISEAESLRFGRLGPRFYGAHLFLCKSDLLKASQGVKWSPSTLVWWAEPRAACSRRRGAYYSDKDGAAASAQQPS